MLDHLRRFFGSKEPAPSAVTPTPLDRLLGTPERLLSGSELAAATKEVRIDNFEKIAIKPPPPPSPKPRTSFDEALDQFAANLTPADFSKFVNSLPTQSNPLFRNASPKAPNRTNKANFYSAYDRVYNRPSIQSGAAHYSIEDGRLQVSLAVEPGSGLNPVECLYEFGILAAAEAIAALVFSGKSPEEAASLVASRAARLHRTRDKPGFSAADAASARIADAYRPAPGQRPPAPPAKPEPSPLSEFLNANTLDDERGSR